MSSILLIYFLCLSIEHTYLTNLFLNFKTRFYLFIYCSLCACPYNYQSEIFSKVVRSILILPRFFWTLIFIKVQNLEKLLNIVRIYLQRIPISLKNASKFINTIFEYWFYFIIEKNPVIRMYVVFFYQFWSRWIFDLDSWLKTLVKTGFFCHTSSNQIFFQNASKRQKKVWDF